MEDPTPLPASQEEPKDERAEWLTPTVTDYDIEEATLTAPPSGTADAGIYS